MPVMSDITIYEVGPRDGLQNLEHFVPTQQKRALIKSLRKAGLKNIEVTSFAHPKYVPQMADAEEVFDGSGAVLVMNQRGMDRALAAGATHFNIVYSPSDTFNEKNLGCDLKTALARYIKMLEGVPKSHVRVYLSCFFGCPYEGEMSEGDKERAIRNAGIFGDTVVLCDTVGVGTGDDIRSGVTLAQDHSLRVALHLHIREGRLAHGLSLVRVAYETGVREFDSSIGGLGGCPFAPGSPGNLPTEALVNWCQVRGIDCGLAYNDLRESLKLAWISAQDSSKRTLSV